MASISDSPTLQGYRESAKSMRRLLNRQYRYANRRGDFAEAAKAMRAGDEMGLPIGRPARIEEIEGAGEARYRADMEMAGEPAREGGLDSFDFRHSRDGGSSVGGFDFRQKRDRMLPSVAADSGAGIDGAAAGMDADFDRRMGMDADPGMLRGAAVPVAARSPVGGYDNRQTRVSPLAAAGMTTEKRLNSTRSEDFSRAWNTAQTQEDRDMLVERAHGLGVPMNEELRDAALERRGAVDLLESIDRGSPANAPDRAYSELAPEDKGRWDRTIAREKPGYLNTLRKRRSLLSSL